MRRLFMPPDSRSLMSHTSWLGHFLFIAGRFLDEFITYCCEAFEVAVWTSSGRDYADAVVRHVFGDRSLRFFWTAERCTQRTNLETYERYNLKDLRKVRRLGISLEQTLMVDDSPEKLERSYGNHIWIPPFEGDNADDELRHLATYLKSIHHQSNFRTIEKRLWRSNRLTQEACNQPNDKPCVSPTSLPHANDLRLENGSQFPPSVNYPHH